MTKEQLEKHKIAGEKLDFVKNRAFEFIKKNVGRITEYDVNKFILSEYKRQKLITEGHYSVQIVAVNGNAAIPHYFPKRGKSAIIGENCLVLMDIWARLKKKNSPFADITWMGYTGKKVPSQINATLKKVFDARDFCVTFIKKELKQKKMPKTIEVDTAVRKYFGKEEKYFIHGTGHSLGIRQCHGKAFRFSKKSNSRMKTEIPFTIEPGLYFKYKFGIRSEINCWIGKDFKLEITTKVQKELIKI
ncbi:MAG: M24 family metallopeptidase [Parcubacteria group bacterium]